MAGKAGSPWGLMPPQPGAPGGSQSARGAGQSYDQRVASGKKELSFWLPLTEHQKLLELQKALGAGSAKDAIIKAVDSLHSQLVRHGR